MERITPLYDSIVFVMGISYGKPLPITRYHSITRRIIDVYSIYCIYIYIYIYIYMLYADEADVNYEHIYNI